jgi:ribosomal protein S18 acetylase RimI-like enzyme
VITVRDAEPTDAEAIAELAEEMDRFYGATDVERRDRRLKQITETLYGESPCAHASLAWEDADLVGFASYSFLWPAAGLTRSLYLKELYVAAKARRRGIGKLLMRHLYRIAVQKACSRVEWTTDRDNLDAQEFYEMLGVSVSASKLFYRVEGDVLRREAGD